MKLRPTEIVVRIQANKMVDGHTVYRVTIPAYFARSLLLEQGQKVECWAIMSRKGGFTIMFEGHVRKD